ncbi:DUF1611 domain-containing protein [Halorientalis sp.]|uniref:DUF1611 domain-containing protein n=1 Tax=Halorientalis sp. TaxID=1931229 RepID=UPI00261C07C7|nr:DUF1611 domain-containing protein [Halorientalis sp.]
MNVAVLAHERFPDRAKTAVGVLRYAEYDVTAVLDRDCAGERVSDHLSDGQDAPIVAGIDDVPHPVDALVVGVAPVGGDFDESWRPDVRRAIKRGCDVLSGLHYFFGDDEEFTTLADEHGAELRDLRRPLEDCTVSEGRAHEVDAEVVLTVGTDCSTGKMTTSAELVAAARERGLDAALVPTGQTGVLLANWGVVVDRVPSDFVAGAVERMVRERGDDHDLLVVEGQGSVVHPAYSAVTCGILHGAMPDALVCCHEAGREAIHGYESVEIPPLSEVAALYEDLAAPVADTTVAAGSLDTSGLDDADANRAVIEYATAIDAPATDPVRFGAGELLDALD